MLRKLLVLVVLFFSLPLAHADEASKRAKIEEMFTLLKLDSMIDQVMSQSMNQSLKAVQGMFGDKTISAADQKLIDAFAAKVFAAVKDSMSWEKLKPTYVSLYAETYTEEEIDGILTFYKSPAGRAMMAKTPQLLAKSSQLMAGPMQTLQPKMKELMTEFQQQIAAAHKDDQ